MMSGMQSTLVSWLGRTDLRAVTESDQVGIGPIAQALRTGRFARLELLCDCPAADADGYLAWLGPQAETTIVRHLVDLTSPTDFDAIYRQDPILDQDIRQGIDLNGIIDRVARHYLEQAVQATGGNKARVARLLGFGNATTLTNWLERHGVEP
jgi:hypothetical protein